MSEHDAAPEAAESALEPGPAQAAEPSAAAVAVALGASRPGEKLPPEAAAFLKKQTKMLDLQMEHLHEQRALQVEHLKQQEKHLRLRYFGDRLRIGLQMLGILFGVGVAVALGAMVWQAHENHGVTIEALSVPPDLAQRGLTSQVVASQLLDRLSELQAKTVTSRPASTYANDWGDDIKVEIPETGVSIGELNRYLRQWLGSETRITGEVVRTPQGLAVTARAGAQPGATFSGAEADLDTLMQHAAEAVYRQTQPYRWAVYLASTGRRDEALTAYRELAEHGAAEDRAWAYAGWGTLLMQQNDPRQALAKALKAIELNPRIHLAYAIAALSYSLLGRPEDNLRLGEAQLRQLESGHAEGITPDGARVMSRYLRHAVISVRRGDYGDAVTTLRSMPQSLDFEGGASAYSFNEDLVQNLVSLHDVSGAQRAIPDGSQATLQDLGNIGMELEDWPSLRSLIDRAPPSLVAMPTVQSERALVLARLGRLAEAEAAIESTPLDCTDCVLARGLIRNLAGDRRGADRWYAVAAARQDALPFAYLRWGQSLLELGDADGAIAKLKEAHRRSPHYADPLELWGEALMRKGDFAGAVAKFKEADKHAPRWGRNHLRWGEALARLGRVEEARAQYRAAAGMDLSVGDRAALNVHLARGL